MYAEKALRTEEFFKWKSGVKTAAHVLCCGKSC